MDGSGVEEELFTFLSKFLPLMRETFLRKYETWLAECNALSAKLDGQVGFFFFLFEGNVDRVGGQKMIDPFGAERGSYRYAQIRDRLNALRASILSAEHLASRAEVGDRE